MKLLEFCIQIDSGFKKFLDVASKLNPFSTQFRYPTEHDIPDFEKAQFVTKQAQKIVTFVTKKITAPTTGQIHIIDTLDRIQN